jgi:hypothetical protein
MYNFNLFFFKMSSPAIGIVRLSKSVRLGQATHEAHYILPGIVSWYTFIRFTDFTPTNIAS